MVLHLNTGQLALVAPTPLTSSELQQDVRVLFLADTTRAAQTVTHRAGRIGRIRQQHVNQVQNAVRDNTEIDRALITDERRYYDGTVSQVALVNPRVVAGMEIVDIDETFGRDNVGRVGVVTSNGGNYIGYRDEHGHNRSTYRWVVAVSNQVALEDPLTVPEDLRISQWWVNRIQSIARDEGKRRRWCSELEEVLQRLLEPIKAGGYKIEPVSSTDQPDSEVVAYEVWDGTGQFAASFRDEAEAKKYVEEKNKKLPPVYQATL